MKTKLFWILLIMLAVTLIGCDLLGLTNPLVGKWTSTFITFEFKADKTCSAVSSFSEDISTGTWVSDKTIITITWNDSPNEPVEIEYELSDDKDYLTLKGEKNIVLTRVK